LIVDEVRPREDDDILILQSGYGFLGVILGDMGPEGRTVLTETSDRAKRLSEMNLEKNNTENASCRLVKSAENLDGKFDKAFYAPRAYEPVNLVKNRLIGALEKLKLNGELYISGDKNSGIKRYRDLLRELDGELEKTAQGGKNRLYRFKKKSDLEVEKTDAVNNYTASVGDTEVSFTAADGLFSPNRLDEGTRLLIENLEISSSERVLDVACGYGAISVFLKKMYDCEIYLSDDNKMATRFAEKNLKENNIEEYHLETADCLEGFKDVFDAIVANPPTHQGKGITDEIIEESYNRLNDGGQLYMVFNKNMHLEQKMEDVYDDFEIVDQKNKYTVALAIR